jgi:hypothetical protein
MEKKGSGSFKQRHNFVYLYLREKRRNDRREVDSSIEIEMVAVFSWIFLFQLWPSGHKSESKNSNSYLTLTGFLSFNVLDPVMNITEMKYARKKLKQAFIFLSRGL